MFTLLTLLACAVSLPEPPAPPEDWDGDGWPNIADCARRVAAIHPGATEHCDGVDEDCDGSVDEDAVDLVGAWADSDGDGYGDPDGWTEACALPTHVANSDDCDDGDAEVNPDAREVCNGIDDDCDGRVDDDDDMDTGMLAWVDADGDGDGDSEQTTRVCDLPEGYAWLDGDCDDSTALASPGNAEFATPDALSGQGAVVLFTTVSDLGAVGTDDADHLLAGVTDQGLGREVHPAGDLDGDGYDDWWVLDAESAWLVPGTAAQPASFGTDALDTRVTGLSDTTAGVLMLQLDDDDVPDLVLGDPSAADGSGTITWFAGPLEGERDSAEAEGTITGPQQAAAGARLVGHDWDGDGRDELLIAAPGTDSDRGSIFIGDWTTWQSVTAR